MNYENIKSTTQDRVGIVTLDRPDALNALSDDLMRELADALTKFETNDEIGAIIITGSSKAFAAGADIKGMVNRTYMDAYLGEFIGRHWHGVADCRKPIIAADTNMSKPLCWKFCRFARSISPTIAPSWPTADIAPNPATPTPSTSFAKTGSKLMKIHPNDSVTAVNTITTASV